MANAKNKSGAILLVIAVPLLVVAFHLLALTRRSPHLNQVVAELGSISRFMRDPVINHAGDKMLFMKTTDRGYGVFLYDLTSGKRSLIFEEIEKGPGYGDLDETLLGWSPDDQYLAYSRHDNQWQLAICDGHTGSPLSVLPVDHFISAAAWLTPQTLVFADSDRVLHITRFFHDQWLRPKPFKYFQDAAHKPDPAPIGQLAAWDEHTVVWRQGNTLWLCGEDSKALTKIAEQGSTDTAATTATMDSGITNKDYTWYEQGYNAPSPTTGVPTHGTRITSLASPDHHYTMPPSYETNNVVLIDSDITNGTLVLTKPAAFSKLSFLVSAGHGKVTVNYVVHHANAATDIGKFVIPDWFYSSNAAVIVNGRTSVSGHFFGSVNSGNPRLYSADLELALTNNPVSRIEFTYDTGSGHGAIFALSGSTGGDFNPITVSGYNADVIMETTDRSRFAMLEKKYMQPESSQAKRATYAVKALNDEPSAIWKYDDSPGSPQRIVPNAEQPFRYSQYSPIQRGTVTNLAGEKLTYYLLVPPHAPAKKKCPLIVGILGIGEMGFDWSANHEAIANCGAYFVSVDRNQRNYSQWAEDALAVYTALLDRLPINTNQVYLYADSAGTGPVYALLQEHPALWQGAVLFSPGSFPDPTQLAGKRLFFDCGGGDGNLAKRAATFRDQAAQTGLPVTLLVHPGLGHTFRVLPVERERMREALIFLSGF